MIMAYKARTFDWPRVVNGLVKVMRDITRNQVPILADDRVKSTQGYPFITYSDESPHSDQAYSIYKTNEDFHRTLSISCWAETSGEANSISDDLMTLLHDPRYRMELRSYGIALVGTTNVRRRSESMASFMNVTNYGFDLTIALHRSYKSDYPTLNDYGGSNNGTDNS